MVPTYICTILYQNSSYSKMVIPGPMSTVTIMTFNHSSNLIIYTECHFVCSSYIIWHDFLFYEMLCVNEQKCFCLGSDACKSYTEWIVTTAVVHNFHRQ